jgi:CRP-like cAMP-binding protein
MAQTLLRTSEIQPEPELDGSRQTDILARLQPASRREFERHCTHVDATSGDVIFAQGEIHHDSFLITSGLVRTYYLSPLGKEITLAFWSDGNLIGGPDFFGGSPHVWSARCVKDTTMLAIDGPTLKQLTQRLPDLADSVIDALTFKMRWISVLLQTFATECVINRLAHQLARLADMHGYQHDDGVAIRHEFTQEDLATMVGATRQWVSMTLNQMQRANLITFKNRRLIVRDLEALRRFGVDT